MVPGASRVPLDVLARAWDACDLLRVALVGSRDTMGLLARLTEEIGPRLPRTPEGGAEAVVDGVGRLVRHGKSQRERWSPERLIPEVAVTLGARIADEPGVVADEDGVARPPSDIARRAAAAAVLAMSDLCGMTPSRAWKSTALAGLGIDAGDFRTREYSGWSLQVERGVVDVPPSEETDA